MLDDTSLLLIWERGYGRAPCEQALVMLYAADPTLSVDKLMDLSIGQRDRKLLQLRRQLFGDRADSLTACPMCGETVEMSFEMHKLTSEPTQSESQPGNHNLTVDDQQIEFRLPTSRDLLAMTAAGREPLGDQLLAKCITCVCEGGIQKDPRTLAPPAKNTVSRALADNDPHAEILLGVDCTACGHTWNAPFDIARFLWSELNAWCQRLLNEIHLLARAYGWTEREILTLGRWKRQVYLGMVRQ